ncbi:methyltransferase domain-containing protein [Sandaracinus amylolyticus]|uniref:Methyltransferase domain-containing protein n=1 Tax=Sandaracinus amylolyticus TaxID=927083 RepID=A0A0F6YMA5_9BACT|nr:class I SAM-dependent methyltransferase [Sandaracinus amylolyticus]AKF10041.1 hypothetical protein DB32_007190 [Sandaracinus amylolyticus]
MSDRDRLSLVAHAAMPLCNPLALAELDALLERAPVAPGERVLDLGAGRGDAALRTSGAHLTLVDRSDVYLEEARRRARGREHVELVLADAATYLERLEGPVALAICLGASHALSGLETAARALSQRAHRVLIGDLVALGARAEATFGAPPLESLAVGAPHVLLGPDRLRAYEDAWARAVSSHLEAFPHDPAAEWANARIAWMRDHDDALSELAFAAWVL